MAWHPSRMKLIRPNRQQQIELYLVVFLYFYLQLKLEYHYNNFDKYLCQSQNSICISMLFYVWRNIWTITFANTFSWSCIAETTYFCTHFCNEIHNLEKSCILSYLQ